MPQSKRKEDAEPEAPAPIKRRRTKPKKDPTAPKKPLSSFVFFGQTMRPKLLSKSPDMSFTEVGAELGKLWKKLSDAGKKPYDKKAAEDKARYNKEMESYVPDPAFLQMATQKGERMKKDPAKPKRSRSAYLVFCDSHRPGLQEEHAGKKMTDLAIMLAELWKNVSAKERKACEKVAAKEKEDYDEEMVNYIPSEEYVKAKQCMEDARRAAKEKDADSKKKVKDKINKTKGKVKDLQADIAKIEKAVVAAEKAKAKIGDKQSELERTEAKLAALLGPN